MLIGIDPTVDFAFKLLMGSPENVELTIHFLNAVLGPSIRIVHIEILNPIQNQQSEEDKLSILDILARDDQGILYDIEVQTSLPAGLRQRLLYYTATRYVDQLSAGESYVKLRPVIAICVLTRLLFPHTPEPHLDFRMANLRHGVVLTDDLQIHFLELPKYNISVSDLAHATPLEKWCYFLRNASRLTVEQVAEQLVEPEFIQAAGVLKMITQSPNEKLLYEARLKRDRDEAARIEFAINEARSEARSEGLVEGRSEGLAEGRSEGLAEGRSEGLAEGRSEGLAEGRSEGLAEGRSEGLAEGRSEGLAEGRSEGLVEGEIKGRTVGLERGQFIGRIHLLQELLRLPVTPKEELAQMEIENLSRLEAGLQVQLRERS